MSNKKGKIRIVASLEGHVGPVLSVVFHPTAHLMATAGGDNDVKLWDTDSHQCLATLVGHTKEVTCVAFHPTQPVLISGSADKMLIVWDTTTYQWLSTIQQSTSPHAHMYGVTCIAIHPIMSFIVTGGYREPPKLWKLSPDNTKLIHMDNITSAELEDNVSTRCIAVHPTNPFFATGRNYFRHDSAALLWSYQQIGHRVLANLRKEIEPGTERHSSNIVSIAIHPTKPFIATGSDDTTIRLWGVNYTQDGKVGRSECMATLYDHEAAVTGLAFHPTAPILVSCSADTSVHVWGFSDDMRIVDIIGSLFGHRGPVTSIAFHSNGRLLATGNKDYAALLWDSSVLTPEGQRSMGVMRGLELSIVPKLFSRRMHNMQYQASVLRNTLKQRGPDFLRNLEQRARASVARALASRRAMVTARSPIKAMAMIEGPKPRSRSPSPKPRSRSPSPKPRSKSHSKPPSPSTKPSSPKEDKSGGGGGGRTSITRRRRNHSSRKIKRHASKTRRYNRFR
jgi:WD40 repeat protein